MKASQPTSHSSLPKAVKSTTIPKGYCCFFKGGRSVRVVSLNMSVLNVNATMVGYSTIFVPPQEQCQHHLIPSHNLPTPIRAEHLLNLLSGYTLSTTAYLYNGFKNGFPLHFEGEFHSFEAENLLSACDHPDIVSSKIERELAGHHLVGPFHPPLLMISVFLL